MNADALAWFLSGTAFAVAMSATPGPNNAMVAASGANFGYEATLPHLLGITIGFPAMFVAVALGAGDILRSYPIIHEILKWAGACYLLWLAYHIAVARPRLRPKEGEEPAAAKAGKPLSFLRAALFQWINPKAWVAAVTAIATYTTPSGLYVQTALLAVIFLVITFPAISFWTLTGVGAARLLKSERALRVFNLCMAGLLVASLVPLFWLD